MLRPHLLDLPVTVAADTTTTIVLEDRISVFSLLQTHLRLLNRSAVQIKVKSDLTCAYGNTGQAEKTGTHVVNLLAETAVPAGSSQAVNILGVLAAPFVEGEQPYKHTITLKNEADEAAVVSLLLTALLER